MRVLISSAGRRTSLVAAFRKAVSDVGGIVIATDVDPLAPALLMADRGEVVPRLDDAAFPDRFLDLCAVLGVDLVVPTIDTELQLLASMSSELAESGTTALVSDPSLLEIVADKRKTEAVFGDHGIRTPRSWVPGAYGSGELPERVFVKPSRGSSSAHTYSVESKNLEAIIEVVPDPIIQDHIDAPELTVDALLDLTGSVLHLVPRIRLKTIGGESVQGVTMPDEPIRGWLLKVLEVVSSQGGRGPITIQLFLTEDDPTLVEVNPRFGGGFPLTARAGGDYPGWIVRIVRGERLEPRLGEYEKGLFMSRALFETFVSYDWPA